MIALTLPAHIRREQARSLNGVELLTRWLVPGNERVCSEPQAMRYGYQSRLLCGTSTRGILTSEQKRVHHEGLDFDARDQPGNVKPSRELSLFCVAVTEMYEGFKSFESLAFFHRDLLVGC